MSSYRNKTLVVFLLLFLGTRLFQLFFDFSSLREPEELYNGTLAREIIRGPFPSLLEYRFREYASGSLIVSLCAIPCYCVFGQSYLALKLVALVFSAAAFILYYLILRNYYSYESSFWGGLLYVFSPPIFSQLNLKVEGVNSQAILIILAIWYLFLYLFCEKTPHPGNGANVQGRNLSNRPIAMGENSRRRSIAAILIGFLFTFGFWFCPAVFVAALCIVILWRMSDAYFIFSRRFAVASMGMLLGTAPIMYDYLHTNFEAIRYFGSKPFVEAISSMPIKFAGIWGYELARSLSYGTILGVKGCLLSGYFYVFMALSMACCIYYFKGEIFVFVRNVFRLHPGTRYPAESLKAVFPLFYLVVFSCFYAVTTFRVSRYTPPVDGYRYFLSFYYFYFMLMAITIGEALRRRHYWLKRICISVILINVIYSFGYAFKGNFAEGLRSKGYTYEMLGVVFYENCPEDPNRAMETCQSRLRDGRERDACKTSVAILFLCDRCSSQDGVSQGQCLSDSLTGVAEKWHHYFYRILGQEVALRCLSPKDVPRWEESFNGVPEEYKTHCYEGVGRALNGRLNLNEREAVEYLRRVPLEFRPALRRGLNLPLYCL